jgi:hypothetical protein
MDASLILDAVVAILLAATIGYAIQLNRRLNVLRSNRTEFDAIIAEFNDATRRAETSIHALRAAAEQGGKQLQLAIDKAQALRDELAFLVSRADDLAGKMTAPSAGAGRPEAPRPEAAKAKPEPAAARTAAKPVEPSGEPRDEPGEGGRSKAERDLLKALRELR